MFAYVDIVESVIRKTYVKMLLSVISESHVQGHSQTRMVCLKHNVTVTDIGLVRYFQKYMTGHNTMTTCNILIVPAFPFYVKIV